MYSLKKSKYGFFIWTILYRITLEIIYKNILCQVWSYSGFKDESTVEWYVLSWVVFLIFLPFIKKFTDYKRPSSMMLLIINLLTFIPGTVMLGYQPTSISFAVQYIIYWGMITISYKVIYLPKVKKPTKKVCCFITECIACFFSIVVIFIWAYYAHFRITINILNVYGIRSEASQYSIPGILSYILAASRSIIPCLCVYRLARKEYIRFSILFLVQIINFSIDGLKSALFALVLSVGCYFFYNHKFKKQLSAWLLALNVVALSEEIILGTVTIIAVFIRRVIFIPSLFNYYYYDFFSTNEFDYFKQSFLKYFGFVSNYSERIPFLIGSFKGQPGEYANNGLFSDAYSNLGSIGILIMPIFLVLVLKIFDICSNKLDIKVILGAIVANSMTLISSNLSVFMITQGFLITCMVVYFLPTDIHYREKKRDKTI